jgi:hypothetical protein
MAQFIISTGGAVDLIANGLIQRLDVSLHKGHCWNTEQLPPLVSKDEIVPTQDSDDRQSGKELSDAVSLGQ